MTKPEKPGAPGIMSDTLRLALEQNEAWMLLIRRIGQSVNCLYSTFPDGNEHIVRTVAALAAAEQPAAPAHPVYLNGYQLREALAFIAPDADSDPEQLESEVVIQHLPARVSTEGEPMEAGYYAWLSDHPEEGCIPLSEKPSEPTDRAAPGPAQPDPRDDLVPRIIAAYEQGQTEQTNPHPAMTVECEAWDIGREKALAGPAQPGAALDDPSLQEPACAKCGCVYSLDGPEFEPTRYCTPCAHDIAEAAPLPAVPQPAGAIRVNPDGTYWEPPSATPQPDASAGAQRAADALDAARYRWLRSVGEAQLDIMAHYACSELDMMVDIMRAAPTPATPGETAPATQKGGADAD